MVEVPAVPFVIYSLIGTAAWATGLSVLGYELSSTVNKFFHSFSLVGGTLVVVLLAGLIAHRIHAIRKDSARISAAQADHSGQADEADQASPNARPARPARPASRTGGAHRSGRGPAA